MSPECRHPILLVLQSYLLHIEVFHPRTDELGMANTGSRVAVAVCERDGPFVATGHANLPGTVLERFRTAI